MGIKGAHWNEVVAKLFKKKNQFSRVFFFNIAIITPNNIRSLEKKSLNFYLIFYE